MVILRQDLMSVRRRSGPVHVLLTLPGDVDVLPFLVELWRARVTSGSLGDHYEPAPVVVGVEPASFLVDIGCAHQAVRLWSGRDRGEALSPAEAAVRQVEAADALIVPTAGGGDGGQASAAAALAARLNARAGLMTFLGDAGGDPVSPASLVRTAPAGGEGEWRARLEPVTVLQVRSGADRGAVSVLWQSRRPLHPGRLADALPVAMRGVVRGRGHLWLCSRPDSVVTWRSAGHYLELREADRWLEPADARAWAAASPQRRILASWFWDDYYGERRDEIVLTGIGLDESAIRDALEAALLTDAEPALGRDGWAAVPDPLLGSADAW